MARFGNAVVCVASMAAIGCGSLTESTVRDIGWIGYARDRRIDAPDTARVGVPFTATVYSWGSRSTPSCNQPDGAEVSISGMLARMRTYVRIPTGNYTCAADLGSFPQTLTLKFSAAGIATLRHVGLAQQYGSVSTALDSLERTVVVLP
jgi:hypothetical protein